MYPMSRERHARRQPISSLLRSIPIPAAAARPIISNIVTGTTAQPFGGFVQHHRPAGLDCLTKPLPPLSADDNLPNGNSGNPNDFYRSVDSERGRPISA